MSSPVRLSLPAEDTICHYLNLHPATTQFIQEAHNINEIAAIYFANKTVTIEELRAEVITLIRICSKQSKTNLPLGVIVNLGLSLSEGLQDCAMKKNVSLVAKL